MIMQDLKELWKLTLGVTVSKGIHSLCDPSEKTEKNVNARKANFAKKVEGVKTFVQNIVMKALICLLISAEKTVQVTYNTRPRDAYGHPGAMCLLCGVDFPNCE